MQKNTRRKKSIKRETTILASFVEGGVVFVLCDQVGMKNWNSTSAAKRYLRKLIGFRKQLIEYGNLPPNATGVCPSIRIHEIHNDALVSERFENAIVKPPCDVDTEYKPEDYQIVRTKKLGYFGLECQGSLAANWHNKGIAP